MQEISEFSKVLNYTSKLRPTVSFVVRRLNLIGRIERDASIVEELIEHDDIIGDIDDLKKVDPPTRAITNKIKALSARLEYLYFTKIIPVRVKASLVSISGVTGEDGKPLANPLDILGLPDCDDLIAELYGACNAAAEKNAQQLKNWLRPGTSSELATPAVMNSTVATANESDSTTLETADTSQKISIAA